MAFTEKDRYDVVKALYSINSALQIMHSTDLSRNVEMSKAAGQHLMIANEAISALMKRMADDHEPS